MTLEEYEKLNQQAIQLDEKRKHEDWKYHVDNADEIAAKYKREKLKQYRKKNDDKEEKSTKKEPVFAAPDEIGGSSIGGWQVVEER